MRTQYAATIYKQMEQNTKILSVVADSGTEEFDKIRNDMPNRLIECGIAEANAIGVAAGLAASGSIPIVYGMGAFLVYRALEFIRDDVCLQNLNVKIIGSGGGVGYNNLGPTHHTTEDIGVLRSLPNLKIFSPSTPKEVEPILNLAIHTKGPVYVRFGKAYEEEIFEDVPELIYGKANTILDGNDFTIVCTGSIISDAVKAAKQLKKENIHVRIINFNQLKPIDSQIIIKAAKETSGILCVEEHTVIGGLSTIVAEILAQHSISTRFDKIGFQDVFCTHYGWRQDLRRHYGISENHIIEKIYSLLKEKQR